MVSWYLNTGESSKASKTAFQERILKWYNREGRKHLPWREDADPYKVLVAEILLRKTRMDQALDAFREIIKKYPDPEALMGAGKGLEDIIAPIGLVSRAGQLRRIARRIIKSHGGQVPTDLDVLQSLPGVGRYVASSILAFGYGKEVPIVDGNVSRIYSRIFGKSRKKDPSRDREMWRLAEEMLPRRRVKEFNAAPLDFGALICTPQNPKCDQCFLKDQCFKPRED